jgi:Protein of unknown function (DUF3187)
MGFYTDTTSMCISATLRLASLMAVTLLGSCVTPPGFGGPMAVRNQHPAQLVVLRMEPASGQTLPAGASRAELSTSYSSLFLRGTGATDTFVMDGELLRTSLGAKYGLTESLQVDVAVPIVHTSSGFLDRSIEDWHDIIGTPDSGRRRVQNNQYAVNATRNGQSVYSLDQTTLALMDIPVGLTWQLWRPTADKPFAFAVRGAVEFPTGDAEDGTGNGGFDFAFGAVGEILLGPLNLTAHGEYTFAHTPDRSKAAGLDFGDVASGGVGIETALTMDTTFLAQIEIDQSVLRNLKNANTDATQVMLWLGFRTRLSSDVSVEVGFAEDLAAEVSPDFTAFLAFRVGR